MRDANLPRFKTVLVDNELFSGEDEPDRLGIRGIIFIGTISAFEKAFGL